MNLKRKTYKVLFIFCCSVLTFSLCACSGDSYPGLTYDEINYSLYDINSEGSSRLPITVFIENPLYIPAASGGTRADLGTGPWDEYIDIDGSRKQDEDWSLKRRRNTYFHLFAFREKAEDNPPLNTPVDLRFTFYDDEPSGNGNCLIDATADGDNTIQPGMPVQINDEDESISLLRQKSNVTEYMYWSYTYQQTSYVFSMYHIDDLGTFNYPSHITRRSGSGNQIYYDFKINGQHDVMFGRSVRPTTVDEVKALVPVSAEELTDNELKNMVEYGYSTYSAHRNMNPKITMNHCLTRLQFYAYPGDSTVNYITVTGIDVESKTNAHLLVASNNPADELGLHWSNDTKEYVSIGQWNDDKTLVEDFEGFTFAPSDYVPDVRWQDQNKKKIGAPIMLAPEEIFNIRVRYRQAVPDYDELGRPIPLLDDAGNQMYDEYGVPMISTSIRDLTTPYRISPPAFDVDGNPQTFFKPGYIYNISLVIYGLAGIKVYVDITPWNQGGDVDVEPDYGFAKQGPTVETKRIEMNVEEIKE